MDIFRLDPDGKQQLPSGSPALVTPDYSRKQSLEDIRSNIARLKAYLTYDQFQWWQSFLTDPGCYEKESVWYLERLLTQVVREDDLPRGEDVASPLALAMTKERSIPRVQTGTKRMPKAKETKKPGQTTPSKKKETHSWNRVHGCRSR